MVKSQHLQMCDLKLRLLLNTFFPSGFYIVDFIQIYRFHYSLDAIISISSHGAARGTLRPHSRELFFFLLFTCLFNSGETFYFNEMTYLTSLCGQRYFLLKFGQFVHVSGTKIKK